MESQYSHLLFTFQRRHVEILEVKRRLVRPGRNDGPRRFAKYASGAMLFIY